MFEKLFDKFLDSYNPEKARKALRAATPPSKIEKRKGSGKTQLNYVSGQYVTNRVIEDTDNMYDFEILSNQVVQAEPKPAMFWDDGEKRYKARLDQNSEPVMEHQAPFVIVHGRLTVPGLGSRDQYGMAELLGGTTEQGQAFKGAATDCLKKCASLFGVALDLYADLSDPYEKPAVAGAPKTNKYIEAAEATKVNPWKQEDIDGLKKIKADLGIINNAGLDSYAAAFIGDDTATSKQITPSNARAFIQYMTQELLKKGA
jgi:hypothetical protein